MLLDEYSYETDIEVQRQEAAEKAAEKATAEAEKKAQMEADRKYVEYVEKVSEILHVSAEQACHKLDESYERYLKIKENSKV